MNAIQTQTAGFGPFLRKELLEWWKGRGAVATLVVVGGLGIVGTLATRLDELAGGTPVAGMLQPTANVLGAQFDQWILFAAIFASIGILTQERATGTLAWTLSKPMSRSALLLAKWTAAMVMLTAFAIVLPLAISVGVATWSYGGVPDLATVARYGLVLAALPAFFVALNLALATRLGSQAAIAAIAFAVLAVPYFIGGFLPAVTEFWPTSIAAMAVPFATESTVHVPMVAGWAVALLALAAGGLARFNLEDM